MEKTVSVIIPVYQSERSLVQCVQSVCNQTYTNLEIILVDDGSTDGSPKICDNLARGDKRIKVLHKKNGGVSSARNAGLDMCTGDYIAFVDSDDDINPYMYEKMVSALESENAGIAICGIKRSNDKSEDKNQGTEIITGKENILVSIVSFVNSLSLSACNKLFKADYCKDVRMHMGVAYSEDTLFVFEYMKRVDKAVNIKEKLYCYYVNPESATQRMPDFGKLYSGFIARQLMIEMYDDHRVQKAVKAYYQHEVRSLLAMAYRNNRGDIIRELKKYIRIYRFEFYTAKTLDFRRKIYGFLTVVFPGLRKMLTEVKTKKNHVSKI